MNSPHQSRQGEVEDVDGNDARPDGFADRDSNSRGAATSVVTVVTMDQGHCGGEDPCLDQRVKNVNRWQEQVEIVQESPTREAVELDDRDLGGEIGSK